MSYVQFRVHPALGIARYGNSKLAYYLASDFPQFMQELFPNTRNLPVSRTHPRKLKTFGSGNETKTVPAAGFSIFNAADGADNNYKDTTGRLKPQAARFRIYAYVYTSETSRHPRKVFEVDANMAEITWEVELANLKSGDGANVIPRRPGTATLEAKPAKEANIEMTQIRDGSNPTLAYLMLERDPAQPAKFTGRLHLIGNEGLSIGPKNKHAGSLWNDKWFDSGCDGQVRATVKIKNFSTFKDEVTTDAADALHYLQAGVEAPEAAAAGTQIKALPGWAVVGPPDYSPDMGHFISLYDIALDGALEGARNGVVRAQTKLHKQVTDAAGADLYRNVDYFVHIHPQLCLFSDVAKVSGNARGLTEAGADGADPGHNKARAVPNTTIPSGFTLNARNAAAQSEMNDVTKKKDPAAAAVADKVKPVIFQRLRPPKTLYEFFPRSFLRAFIQGNEATPQVSGFPRRLGRRVDYIPTSTARGTNYGFPSYASPTPRNLRKFHSNNSAAVSLSTFKGKGCGKPAGLAADPRYSTDIDGFSIKQIDDMFWPVSTHDMPLLRELSYTWLQHWQWEVWQAPAPGTGDKMAHIFQVLAPSSLRAQLGTGSSDREAKFAEFQNASPKYAPAMLDMAHAGAALGGSFLPGIEVGREAGIASNWSLLDGGTEHFPDVRFHRIDYDQTKPDSGTNLSAQYPGRLTKDLAIPWQRDFILCDEVFWPTSRPGWADEGGTITEWKLDEGNYTLPAQPAVADYMYFNTYWWRLGFVRREDAPPDTVDFKNREADRRDNLVDPADIPAQPAT